MLSFELNRRAIAVVARLSIFAGLTGCAGSVITDDTDGDTDPDTETGETSAGATTSATTGPTTSVATGETTSGATTDTPTETCVVTPDTSCCNDAPGTVSIPCCNQALLSAFADPAFLQDPSQATAQHKSCCELLVGIADAWNTIDELPFDPSLTYDCCSTGLVEGGWQEHPSCTPWGPPMPPRFRPRRARPRAGDVPGSPARPASVAEVLS